MLYGHALEMAFPEHGPAAGPVFAQWRAIYSFHMPLFFIISGMVHRPRSLRDAAMRSLSLLLLACLVHAAGWIFGHALGMIASPARKSLWLPLLELQHFTVVALWFLVALAFVQFAWRCLQNAGAAHRAAMRARGRIRLGRDAA